MRKLILALAFVLGSCIAPIVGGDAPAGQPYTTMEATK